MNTFSLIVLALVGVLILAVVWRKRTINKAAQRPIPDSDPAPIHLGTITAAQPAPVSKPYSQVNDAARIAWRMCGTAKKTVDQAPQCEQARMLMKRATDALYLLSKRMQEGASDAELIEIAQTAVRNADEAQGKALLYIRLSSGRPGY